MSREGPRLLIRADADGRMGTGHVMRCLALAQCWIDHVGPVTLAALRLPEGLRQRLIEEGVSVALVPDHLGETLSLARELSPAVVVLDGYHFTSEDEQLVSEAGFPVLVFDDFGHARHKHACWILNQNLGARKSWYKQRSVDAKILLGSKYAILRREFSKARTFQRLTLNRALRILVTMGGADPDNISVIVLRALGAIPPRESKLPYRIDVVVGSSNPHLDELNGIAADFPHRIRFQQNVRDMTTLMAQTDLAITAGGTTCWELAAFGVPMIVLTIAQNQVELAKAIAATGLAVNLGWPSETTSEEKTAVIRGVIENSEQRSAMSVAGRLAVDGWGVTRVVQQIQPIPVITLLKARRRDARAIWRWANDPETRGVSFTQGSIPWENHLAWFKRKLTDSGCLFLIGFSAGGKRVGMIRFDTTAEGIVVSVNIAPKARGRGIGGILIRNGTKMAHAFFNGRDIMAWVLPTNPASKRVFEKAGYADTGLHEFAGRPAFRLVYGDNR